MGNCCSGSDKNFQGEGRTLGAAPANPPSRPENARAAAPPKITARRGGRTLGEAIGESQTPGQAAARAAQERAKINQGKGKLGKQLDAQRAQTQASTLTQTAHDNVAARNADAAAEARNWD